MADEKLLDAYRRRVSKDEINALPLFHYTGQVDVVRTKEDWEQALPDISSTDVLGFDTETRPTFRKGKVNAPSLVQLATATRVYLVQLSWLPFDAYLADLLANPSVIKAGVGIRFDMQSLGKLFSFTPKALVDLGSVARLNKLSSQGLRTLAAVFFGWRISKGSQCSNWSLLELSARQIVYAATDAWISRLIYLKMKDSGFVFSRTGDKSPSRKKNA
ncbi:MAG: 3'-5' exonuclease domain-containing protein 2 [Desulfovibrio sp.]|nr:3'-5' exonuclease domain-containing protein 2 [Desulfovibrio sp.]